mmetsp:Transcript_75464/g.161689  ORF Transcript_75464/g.161689 Transcript_75464/m.161689 type:complete len:846 (-) Transcript_75464:17-2554(-)
MRERLGGLRAFPALAFALIASAVAQPQLATGVAIGEAAPADGRGRILKSDGDGAIRKTFDKLINLPPSRRQTANKTVYYTLAGFLCLCACILLVGLNIDAAETRKRLERAIVPEDSVPCEITEQFYLDSHLLSLRSAKFLEEKEIRMTCRSYVSQHYANFFDILSREHLFLSFLFKSVPTFTRAKRGTVIVLQFHLCMLAAAVAFNVREHDAPRGKYEVLSCETGTSAPDCIMTLPWALIAAVIFCPIFRLVAFQQMRRTCLVTASHPTKSPFKLRVKKFARQTSRSLCDLIMCRRYGVDLEKARVKSRRSCPHRMAQTLWHATQPSVKDLRFYSTCMSWCMMLVALAMVLGTIAYTIFFTAYLEEDVVYHWLTATLIMFFSSTLVLEPLLIFWVHIVWRALVASWAQHWGFGAHALAATKKYQGTVLNIEFGIIIATQDVAAKRIQRWWVAVLDMYRAIHEKTVAAIRIQAVSKKTKQKRLYTKERKWCMKVDVLGCSNLEQVTFGDLMSPMVRLQCDVVNPNEYKTHTAWESGVEAKFKDTFWVDIKESNSMYVSAWSQGLHLDSFVGRGMFEFNPLKGSDAPGGHLLKIPLYTIQHGEQVTSKNVKILGYVELRATFLDPLKDSCGNEGDEDWMLPKNRMKLALSKMSPDSKLKVGKMLGNLTPRKDEGAATPPTPPSLAGGAAAGLNDRPAAAAPVQGPVADGSRQMPGVPPGAAVPGVGVSRPGMPPGVPGGGLGLGSGPPQSGLGASLPGAGPRGASPNVGPGGPPPGGRPPGAAPAGPPTGAAPGGPPTGAALGGPSLGGRPPPPAMSLNSAVARGAPLGGRAPGAVEAAPVPGAVPE